MGRVLITVFFVVAAAASASEIGGFFQALRREAEARSPDLAIARAGLEQKRAQAHTALARWLPKVDAQLSQSVMKDFTFLVSGQLQLPAGFPSFQPQETVLAGWALRGSMPLYRRSVHANFTASRSEKAAAELAVEVKRLELDWRLRERLGAYLLASYKVATVAGSIELARRSEREAKLRFELGQRTRIDVLRAEANLQSLESRRLAYEEDRQASYDQLLEYSGLDDAAMRALGLERISGDEAGIAASVGEFAESDAFRRELGPYLGEAGRAAARQRLVSESPSYRAILADEEVATAQAAQLSAADWPDLSLSAAVYSQNRNWGDLFAGRFISYSGQILLSIPLYLGGSAFSSTSEQASAEKAARLKRERDAVRLRNEAESLRSRLESLARTVDSLRLGVEQNEEIVRLSGKSYQLGKTTIVELLGSQNDLLDSKTNYAKARLDQSVALRRYAALLGVNIP